MKSIPKIIHIIWIGSGLSEEYQENIRSWVTMNPDYKVWLWIDSDTVLETSKLIQQTSQLANEIGFELHDVATEPSLTEFKAEPFYVDWVTGVGATFAFAADALRLKLLDTFGGVYVDADTRAIKPLGNLENNLGLFFCGAYNKDRKLVLSDNYFIASLPNSKLLTEVLNKHRANYQAFMLDGCNFFNYRYPENDTAVVPSLNTPDEEINGNIKALRMLEGGYRNKSARCFGANVLYSYTKEFFSSSAVLNIEQCLLEISNFAVHIRNKSWRVPRLYA